MASPLQPEVAVNGETIPAAAIAAEAQLHPAPPGKPGLAWRAAARALAVRALLRQEAGRIGLAAEPRDLGEGRRETEEEALIRALVEARVSPEPPAEAAVRAAYDRDPDAFRAPTLYAAAHILIAAPPDDAPARASADALARMLLAELAADPGAFERLARENSACSSREAGGRLGQIGAGETVPEFEAALDRLEPGEIAAEPVATRYGLHIIRLDARARGEVLPYDRVAPRIREALERAAWARAARELVAGLAAEAEIRGVDLRAA